MSEGFDPRRATLGETTMAIPTALTEPASRPELIPLEPSAFGAFYDAMLPRVYGYFVARVGAAQTAEELTQETFVAAVAELRKGRRADEPERWLFGIARHKLVDHYRGQRRRRERHEDHPPEVHGPGLVTGGDVRDATLAALAAVPAAQRGALVLRYVDGYSTAEVARLLGRSPKAVESLLGRARQTFKRAYLEESR